METIYFKGAPCHTYGTVPAVGEKAPCFNLVNMALFITLDRHDLWHLIFRKLAIITFTAQNCVR